MEFDMFGVPRGYGLKDPSKVPSDEQVEEAKQRALTEHKRKVSQLASLKQDFGEYLTQDAADDVAKAVMQDIRPNTKTGKSVYENSVQASRSRFDDDEVIAITNRQNEVKLVKATDATAHIDSETLQKSVSKAMTHHNRKVSQFESLRQDMAPYFNDAESRQIAAHIMQGVRTAPNVRSVKRGDKKRASIIMDAKGVVLAAHGGGGPDVGSGGMGAVMGGTGTRESDDEGSDYGDHDEEKGDTRDLQREINELRAELREKNSFIIFMQTELNHLAQSKLELALSTNKVIDELRAALVVYQKMN